MSTDVKSKPKRNYQLADGTKVKGVTTILGNLGWKTPGLTWWAFKLGQEHPELRSPYESVDEAADIGTVVHRAVELLMHGLPDAEAEKQIAENLGGDARSMAETALLGFYQYRDSTKLTVLETEIALVSEEYGYGGTVDYLIELNGARYLADLKTASAIYGDMWVQLAAYGQLLRENRPDEPIAGFYIFRVDKETGGFDVSYRPALSEAWKVFQALLAIEANKKKVK